MEEFVKKYKIDKFYEVSAKDGTNVEKLFVDATKIIYNDFNELDNIKMKRRRTNSQIKMKSNNMDKSGGCC